MVHNILHTFHIERCAFFNAHAAILVEANARVCVIDVISDFLDPQLSTIVQHFRGILIIGIPPLYVRQGTAKQPKLKSLKKEEGNVLFNDALNIFYLRLLWRRAYGKGPLKMAQGFFKTGRFLQTAFRKEGRKEGNVLFNDAINTF